MDKNFTAKIKLLIVGCGSIGQRHARLASAENMLEVWACDNDDNNLAAVSNQAEIKMAFKEFSQGLNAGPDIVFLCTPNNMHAPMAVEALRHGVDVFVEKPLSNTLEEARKIVSAANETGRMLAIGYMMRFHAALDKMKQLVEGGTLGKVVSGRAMIGTYNTLLASKTPFAKRIFTPGDILYTYTHEFDFLRWLFGDLNAVYCQIKTAGDLPMKPPDNLAVAVLEYSSSAVVSLHMDYIQHPQRRMLEIYGDRGTAAFDFQTGCFTLFQHRKTGCQTEFIRHDPDYMYRQQLSEVLLARQGKTSLTVTPEDACQAIVAAEACLRSAREDKKVKTDQLDGELTTP